MSQQQPFTVRLEADRHAALKLISDVLGTSMADLVRTAVDGSIDETFSNPTFRQRLDEFHAAELQAIERRQSP